MAAAAVASTFPSACLERPSERVRSGTPETVTPPPRSVSPSSDASEPERGAGGTEDKYGVLSTFDEGMSTTKVDPSTISADKRAEAERIAREIEVGVACADGPHADAGASSAPGQAECKKKKKGGSNRNVSLAVCSAPEAGVGQALEEPAEPETATAAASIAAPGARAAASSRGGVRKSRDRGRDSGYGSAVVEQAPESAPSGFTGGLLSCSDRRIIDVLAASAGNHSRLVETARKVPDIIRSESDDPAVAASVELYGSLSLDMDTENMASARPNQEWPSYYINGRSDVDFVVEVGHETTPAAIAARLQSKGPWTVVAQTKVHKFASTQYTLFGSFHGEEDADGDASKVSKVYLDVTCIESSKHYYRFKQRQEAFRKVFTDVRCHMEAQFQAQGALAFDAYIHLLKAFAAKVPGNALTGFQATCVGLFTLQIGHFRFKPGQSIALSLFEGFLKFCRYFFGEVPQNIAYCQYHYRMCGIDLSNGGRWLYRMSTCWRSELYFMATEINMKTPLDERVNVLHSLDPARVSVEAQNLLASAFLDRSSATGISSSDQS